MWRWRRTLAKLNAFFHQESAERELAREVESHLALMEDDFQRRGMTPEEARMAARRAYGGIELVKERHREERSIVWLEQALQDLRYACRSLASAPGFTLVAVATLTLGMGVNTTLFSTYNAVALKPLPVADPSRVVRLERWFESGSRGDIQYAFSYPEYLYYSDHNSAFASLVAGSWPQPVIAEGGGGASFPSEKLMVELVSGNYFSAMGIHAMLGRTFDSSTAGTPGADAVIVLSYPFWQRRFHWDTQVLGQILHVNGAAFMIAGVARTEFTGTSTTPQAPDFWAPISMQAWLAPGSDWLREPDNLQFQILARLRPDAGLRRAEAEAGLLVRQYAATFIPRDKTMSITLQKTALFGNTDDVRFKAAVALLMLVVGMVLMVACANVANLMLARGAARQKEMAVRLALGASRGRVIRQLLTESALLAALGDVGSLLASIWSTKLLWISVAQTFAGPSGPGLAFRANLRPDALVLGYAFVLSLGTGVFFGLSPALQFSKPDLTTALKEEGRLLGQRWSGARMRGFLVAVQVAVSMVLLIGAGLLLRGLMRSQAANPGFATRNVFLVSGDFGNDARRAEAAQRRLLDRLRTLTGIEGAAFGTFPMSGTWTPPILVEGAGGSETGRTLASYASDTYLKTLGIELLRGRNFTDRESAHGERVAIISESTARRFWPRGDPLGKRFKLDMDFNGQLTGFEVVGSARDARFAKLTRVDPAHVYLPTGDPAPRGDCGVLLRTRGNPQTTMASVRSAAGALDNGLLPGLSIASIADGPLRLQKSMAQTYAMYAGILALLALSLASIGIYGVVSYLVSQRVPEIGIRVALGASQASVLKTVIVRSLRPAFGGILLGVAGAAGLSWILHATLMFPGAADFLYGVPFYDPATFLGLSCLLVLVAAVASLVPARHALRVDPMVALRSNAP